MTTHPQMAGIGAGISIPAFIVSRMAEGLPVVQFIAACVAIVAGALSIYSWFRNKA